MDSTVPPIDSGRGTLDGGPGDSGPSDSGPGDAGPPDVPLFVHSPTTLYRLAPLVGTFVEVAPFFATPPLDVSFTVADIAVDSSGQVFVAANDDGLWRVNTATAQLTRVGSFGPATSDLMVALTFLPPTESPSGSQMLIGAVRDGTYYSVSSATGAAAVLGAFPDGWGSSGDIVSIAGRGTFATLQRVDFTGDMLARLTFASDGTTTVTTIGIVTDSIGPVTQIFGIAYYGSWLYGFTNGGQRLRIDPSTATAVDEPIPSGATQFWGAGVTPSAPVF